MGIIELKMYFAQNITDPDGPITDCAGGANWTGRNLVTFKKSIRNAQDETFYRKPNCAVWSAVTKKIFILEMNFQYDRPRPL